MRSPQTPEEAATIAALWRAILLVLAPGLVLALALIWLVRPPYKPPLQNWADGTYVNACCGPLILRGGRATAGGNAARYAIEDGKVRMQLSVPVGIGVRHGKVEFVGSYILADFSGPRSAGHGKPEGVRLFGIDDNLEYDFVRQE